MLYYPQEHSLPSSSAPAVSFQFQSCKLGNITSAAVPHKLIIDRIITKDMLMSVAISLHNAACRDASELRLVMLSPWQQQAEWGFGTIQRGKTDNKQES